MDIFELFDAVDFPGSLVVNEDILDELEILSDQFKENFNRNSRVFEFLNEKIRNINHDFANMDRREIQGIFEELEDTLYYVCLSLNETKEIIIDCDSSISLLRDAYSMELYDLISEAKLKMIK